MRECDINNESSHSKAKVCDRNDDCWDLFAEENEWSGEENCEPGLLANQISGTKYFVLL